MKLNVITIKIQMKQKKTHLRAIAAGKTGMRSGPN